MLRMSKRHLKDLTIEEARGWTIDRILQIESKINRIIIDYFKPTEKHKFDKIILNSSILDMGIKLKILSNTGKVDKKTIEKIRKLVAIRNGFAHAQIIQSINMVTRDPENKKSNEHRPTEIEDVIDVMNSQGVIKSHNAVDYLEEFFNLYKEINKLV